MNDLILLPVLFMGLLSTLMLIWMYATRLPASMKLQQEGINLQELSHPSALGGVFPSKVERVADNYNHLWEQPTLFYAVVFVIWAQNHTDQLYLNLAWTYCVLRFFHSIVQSTSNHVWARFSLFILSWCALTFMLLREIFLVLTQTV
ncbi:MAG: hypothetical protein CMQ39_04035 [Gammaproteobacteria bacterium]|nr:hypothetical protein [Gammaproteobacteria bacterium]